MTPLQQAENEWETNTVLYPKEHQISKFRREFRTHDFRRFEQAIALISWTGEYIEIQKLEKLPEGGRGAAYPLVNFLKALADKYHVRLSGQAKPYKPDPPWPDDHPIPSKEELEAWYIRRGFHLFSQEKSAPTWIWYPDVPSIYTDDRSGCLPAG
ncbi:MAG: hypothetical protein WCS94_00360 [Verrucomicrobiota bacterium]